MIRAEPLEGKRGKEGGSAEYGISPKRPTEFAEPRVARFVEQGTCFHWYPRTEEIFFQVQGADHGCWSLCSCLRWGVLWRRKETRKGMTKGRCR